MSGDGGSSQVLYKVVVNHEAQYSIWLADQENPRGWKDAGKIGARADCLEYIDRVWTDMRPRSLREALEGAQASTSAESTSAESTSAESTSAAHEDGAPATREAPGPSLVERLCERSHAIEAALHPEKTARALRDAIERRFVHVEFTETRGGTILGLELDVSACDVSGADFDHAGGAVRLVGDLVLDEVRVRCVAELDLSTLRGNGRLERR